METYTQQRFDYLMNRRMELSGEAHYKPVIRTLLNQINDRIREFPDYTENLRQFANVYGIIG